MANNENDNEGGESRPAANIVSLVQAAEEFQATPKTDEVVAMINEEFGVVIVGDSFLILREETQPDGRVLPVFWKLDTLKNWYANRFIQVVNQKSENKWISWARLWLASSYRRQYRGMAFAPGHEPNGGAPDDIYNLWRGFDVEPVAAEDVESGGYALFAEHLLTNVCGGDADLYKWVFGWFAHMMQNPTERLGTALVMRGKQGTGKTIVGEIIGALISAHYFLADDPRYITGQFNAHMASCLLLQVDEGFWAGDKAAEGRLKGLITSSIQFVERKGVDPIPMKNLVRLLVTSNHDWIVPAGFEERRFCVLDVGEGRMQDHAFFGAMMAEMESGGYAALLYDLLNYPLDRVNLRRVPATAALFEQKIATLSAEDSWWFDRLVKGAIRDDEFAEWPREISKKDVQASYLKHTDHVGIKRRAAETSLGMVLKRRLCPRVRIGKYMVDDYDPTREEVFQRRMNGYRFPPLAECRAEFERLIGWTVDWDGM